MDLSERQQLAAAFQIAAEIHGWDQLIYNHFTVRVRDRFLVHPFGLLFSEVTASSLLEVDLESGALVPGQQVHEFASPDMPYNATSHVLHSAVYKARKDVNCVLHLHLPCVVSVASSATGLIIGLSQESSLIGPVAYHDYEGISTSLDEQKRIVSALGDASNVLMLRNHGVLCCGTNVAHAMSVMYHVWRACQIQVNLAGQQFVLPPPHVIRAAFETHANFTKSGNHNLEFAALVRRLRSNNNKKFLE